MMKLTKLICFALAVSFLAACASPAPKVKTEIVNPPKADMKGVKTITVVPFELQYNPDSTGKKLANVLWSALGASYNQDTFTTAQFLTSEVIRYVQGTGLYNVMLYSEKLFTASKPQIDAFITGEILELSVNDDSEVVTEARKNKKGVEENIKITYYTRSVKLKVTYKIVRVSDNKVIYEATRSATTNSERSDRRYGLASVERLAKQAVSKIVAGISKEIAPWTSSITYQLEQDKMKDSKMQLAQEYVLNSMFDRALETYVEVYNATGNPAAGYNTAILLDIMGDPSYALEVMEGLLETTQDATLQKKIIQVLPQMQGNLEDQQKLQDYLK